MKLLQGFCKRLSLERHDLVCFIEEIGNTACERQNEPENEQNLESSSEPAFIGLQFGEMPAERPPNEREHNKGAQKQCVSDEFDREGQRLRDTGTVDGLESAGFLGCAKPFTSYRANVGAFCEVAVVSQITSQETVYVPAPPLFKPTR